MVSQQQLIAQWYASVWFDRAYQAAARQRDEALSDLSRAAGRQVSFEEVGARDLFVLRDDMAAGRLCPTCLKLGEPLRRSPKLDGGDIFAIYQHNAEGWCSCPR